MFKFTTLQAAYAYAQSNEGRQFCKEQYVAAPMVLPFEKWMPLYGSPAAAALAALARHADDGEDYDELAALEFYGAVGDFSVGYIVFDTETDGSPVGGYGAFTGQDDELTHTDRAGFERFLANDDWLEPEWTLDIREQDMPHCSC